MDFHIIITALPCQSSPRTETLISAAAAQIPCRFTVSNDIGLFTHLASCQPAVLSTITIARCCASSHSSLCDLHLAFGGVNRPTTTPFEVDRERLGHSQWVPLNLVISRYGALLWLSRDVLRHWSGLCGSRTIEFLSRLYTTSLQRTSQSPPFYESGVSTSTQHTDGLSSFSPRGETYRNGRRGNCRDMVGASCQA